MRAFIAVTLPPEVRRLLDELQKKLQNAVPGAPVKWVETENLHLTLAFLGDIDEARAPEILAAMQRARAGTRPFSVTVTGLGVFPNPRRPRIVWAGLGGGIAALGNLQRTLAAELEQLGFSKDDKPFRPHLTLGRVRDSASAVEAGALGGAVTGLAPGREQAFRVAELHLIRSRLTPAGPIYTEIGAARLG
jgi:2'-5' RNA ligase